MRFAELQYRWEWHLHSSPEQLWPYVADTNRFNRDTGLPTVQTADDSPLANAHRRLRYVRFGVPFEWEEEPFEWQEPTRFGVRRRYRVGPIVSLRVLVELNPGPGGGTQLVYTNWVQPRSLIGWLGAPIAMGVITRQSFANAFRLYDRLALRSPAVETETARRAAFAPGGEARLLAGRQRLAEQGIPPDLLARLAKVIAEGDAFAVSHLRPYALADAWNRPRRAVLELCLRATREGLLDLQWDLLCPLCGGAKASTSALAEVTGVVHCETCNIDVAANFDRSIELTFRPSAAIRHVEEAAYCVAGPRVTPHVVAQQLLAPAEERILTPRLQTGRYRVRTLGLRGGRFLVAAPKGLTNLSIVAQPGEWPSDEAEVSTTPALRFANATDAEQLFILERLAWSDQAATAAEVTALQTFRDLFSRDLVRPGQHISVGSLTILFTDLRDSTSLYRQIGDAPAFGRVLDHFTVLREEVAREDGAIVKTIGDAIMAVFRRPRSALVAILRAQQRLSHPGEGSASLCLKAGVHQGPCIAVTLNDRLDYFGSTVNLASRLERFSSGADVVLSDAIHDDPEVAELLAASTSQFFAEPFEAQLKGFENESFRLWRVGWREAGQ